MTLWPRTLATRTALLLLAGLSIAQLTGLVVHASGQIDLQRIAEAQELAMRFSSIYRSVVLAQPEHREAALRELDPASGIVASLDQAAATSDLEPTPGDMQRMLRLAMQVTPVPAGARWNELLLRGHPQDGRMLISMRLPNGDWLNERARVRRHAMFWTTSLFVGWGITLILSMGMVFWAMRHVVQPMRRFAIAAEQLGVDVNAAPMPEEGAAESRATSVAFNTMAARIRRFVHDRTFILTAIGHDLRTPITRLKLRAEWMEDEEQQRKMLADLDELEEMVSATLAFGRTDATTEAPTAIDLAELLRTILEEAEDARPQLTDLCFYDGPSHLTIRARPVAMKRALANLVQNALIYGDKAMVCLQPAKDRVVTVLVEDEGPGIPPGDLERVFEPFQRLEDSRNRETGGTGLGLPIARNILRAHGGDVVLVNRAKGGIKAIVTLPG